MLFNIVLFLAIAACSAGPPLIIRPCELTQNQCIGEHLSFVSKCNRNVSGYIPAAYKIRWFRFDAPFFNATYIDTDLEIRNHNKCFVSEFFYSVVSGRFVLSLDCPGLEFESTRTVIQHHTRREDTQYSYKFNGIYPLIRLNIHLARSANLCHSFTYADVTALPFFKINPNDRKTASYLSTDLSFLNIYERETFYSRANLLARYYINAFICDFGCDY